MLWKNKTASSKSGVKLLSDPQEAVDAKKKGETSLFCCRIDLDFNGYYTSFPKEEKTLKHEASEAPLPNQNYKSIS